MKDIPTSPITLAPSENLAKVFNSADFQKFLTKELPTKIDKSIFNSMDSSSSNSSSVFLSKELPKFNSEVFKSKDSFSSLFNSKDWEMKFPTELKVEESQDLPPPALKTTMGTHSITQVDERLSQQQSLSSILSSRDWMPLKTLGSHVDVNYTPGDVFSPSDDCSLSVVSNQEDVLPVLPPARTDWDAMFLNQLKAPSSSKSSVDSKEETSQPEEDQQVPALKEGPGICVPMEQPSSDDFVAGAPVAFAVVETPPKKNKRKRRPRKKIVPDVKDYVEPTESDVLLGRGGRSNHNPGNKRYRSEVSNLQSWYRETVEKDDKTDLSQMLVDYIHAYGGRFLEKDQTGCWFIVPNTVARRKASQALREDNDSAKRAAKRARFLAKKNRVETVGQEHFAL